MPAKRGLGRGLEALIPPAEPNNAGVTQIPVSAIMRNPRQPRTRFDPTALQELANSIREHGVLQPVVVAETETPGRYRLIAGERRLEASRLAGLPTIPAIVREATEQQLLELALIENLQRADLGPLETALAYKQLADDFKLSHEEIAYRVGKKRVTVTNTLRLLKLPQRILDSLANHQIGEGHAKALLSLPTVQAQLALFEKIIARDLTVRQAEELARQYQGHKPAPAAAPPPDPDRDALTSRLRQALGFRVTIRRGRKGGTVIIHYDSDEDLNTIAAAILREQA